MTTPRPPAFGRWLAAIALAGLALRLVVIVGLDERLIAADGFTYLTGAQELVAGNGFINAGNGDEDARNPPGWKVVLALPLALGIDDQLAIQIYAALVGVGAVVAVGFLGRRVVSPTVGLVAAAIAAGYPGFWTYERELHSETGVLLGVALLLLLAYRFRDRPTLGSAVALGAGVGVLTLVRAETLLLAVLLVVPLILGVGAAGATAWGRRLGWLGAAAAVAVLVVTPWTIYNLGRFREPVLVSTGLGLAMAQGNCDATYYGEHFGTYLFGCVLVAVPSGPGARELDPSEQDVKGRKAAIEYARDNLDRVPAVLLARQGRTWGLFRPAQQIRFDSRGSNTPVWIGWTGMISYWLLLPFAIGGAVLLRRRRVVQWPLLTVVASVIVATTLTFGQTRYRAAAEVPLVVLAATAAVFLWSRRSERRDTE